MPRPDDDLDLYVAMAGLTDLEREIVWEVFWRGRTQIDIARERGVTREAISQPLCRALKKLGEALA